MMYILKGNNYVISDKSFWNSYCTPSLTLKWNSIIGVGFGAVVPTIYGLLERNQPSTSLKQIKNDATVESLQVSSHCLASHSQAWIISRLVSPHDHITRLLFLRFSSSRGLTVTREFGLFPACSTPLCGEDLGVANCYEGLIEHSIQSCSTSARKNE